MEQREPAIGADPLRQDEVELRMLASRDRAPGLRLFAADMAMRQDYDLDAIDDLRLVVDEICAILLANAVPDAVMSLRVFVGPDRIEIAASVPLADPPEPVVKPLSMRILEMLSDSFECAVGDGPRPALNLSFVTSGGAASA
jgi:serine/threonine-protein kinase RsbW